MKKPKIFLFGVNSASVLNSLTNGFKQTGIPVKSLSFDFKRSSYNNYDLVECICTNNNPGKLMIAYYKLKGIIKIIKYCFWCDVIHVYGGISKLPFLIISKIVKFKYVTFVGSDIRNAAIELTINPYYKYAYNNDKYEYKLPEESNDPIAVQKYLARLNFKFIVWDIYYFLDKNIIGEFQIIPHASANIDRENNNYMAPNKKPLIVHSPSAGIAKGTQFVLDAVEKLLAEKIEFDFRLIENISNAAYQQLLSQCDIYVDQFIWGAYGVATQQALQMGKVVVCYINKPQLQIYGDEVPIQNATIDNLAEILEKLIKDPDLRNEIGKKSIAYYNKMHSPEAVANKMIKAYNNLSDNKLLNLKTCVA